MLTKTEKYFNRHSYIIFVLFFKKDEYIFYLKISSLIISYIKIHK